ncbi:hypothetical protein H0H81_011789 [Sphagnurus paluster]|uniref:Uncharacterized protein n=1 Tax=Sphagnurus paluster TaxID=117069 RepID=A0A9P7K3M2_9AGAR|nr:hypothetical protein H0H81_011789 [Sphagnurus paluster]
MRFSSVFALASLIVSCLASTAADVQADATAIAAAATTLDGAVTAFAVVSGNTQALAIHVDNVALIAALNKGTTDLVAVTRQNLVPSTLSVINAAAILPALVQFSATFSHALTNLVAEKAALLALTIGGSYNLIKQDLADLNSIVSQFESALIAAIPVTLTANATAVTVTINSALTVALAAFT